MVKQRRIFEPDKFDLLIDRNDTREEIERGRREIAGGKIYRDYEEEEEQQRETVNQMELF